MDFLKENIQWIFSGIGVTVLLAIIGLFRRKKRPSEVGPDPSSAQQAFGNRNIQSGHDTNIIVQNIAFGGKTMTNNPAAIRNKAIELVKRVQREHVRESFGEAGHECFTDDNLEEFQRNRIPETICDRLSINDGFIELVKDITNLEAREKSSILKELRTVYKPTWAEIGRISPEGQTDAGQEAERQIANAIADLIGKKAH
jgi:hypothetical protein